MLRVFLEQLGSATFVRKTDLSENVYALHFQRENDFVTMLWCNGRTFEGPWPVKFAEAINSTGETIDVDSVGESPVYLISNHDQADVS